MNDPEVSLILAAKKVDPLLSVLNRSQREALRRLVINVGQTTSVETPIEDANTSVDILTMSQTTSVDTPTVSHTTQDDTTTENKTTLLDQISTQTKLRELELKFNEINSTFLEWNDQIKEGFFLNFYLKFL